MTDAPGQPEPPPPAPAAEPAPGAAAFTPARPPRFWRLRRRLASLNPGPLLFGPVFQRDMRTGGRRKGGYFARFGVLIVPAGVVAIVFMNAVESHTYNGGSAAARIQSLQEIAFFVAIAVAWCQLIILSFIAPLLSAGAIVEERTARALSVIAASPLSPGRIVGNLFAARIVNLALLAALPIPLILAIRTFGGLQTSYILWSTAIAVCSAVAMVAAGLWGSTRASRPATAVSFAILLLLLHWVGPPLIVLADAWLRGWSQPDFTPFIASPPAALIMITVGGNAPFFVGFSTGGAAAVNCAISLAIALAALLAARWELARLIATDRVELVRKPSRRGRRSNPTLPGDKLVPDSAAQFHETSRVVTGNPVLWRELRQPLFNAPWQRWLGYCGLGLLLLIIHLSTWEYTADAGIAIAAVPAVGAMALFILAAATVPAGTVTSEVEARTWPILLTTPLRPMQLLLPKIAGSLRRLWPPVLFIVLHLLICWLRGIAPLESILFTLVHFGVYGLFLCCTGTFFSLRCRKSAVASIINLVVVFGAWLVGPILIMITVGLLFSGSHNEFFSRMMFSNPFFTYGAALGGLCDNDRSFYAMGPSSVDVSEFYILWTVSLCVYAAIAAVVVAFARADFQRLATARA